MARTDDLEPGTSPRWPMCGPPSGPSAAYPACQDAGTPGQPEATFAALAEAVGLLTARLGGMRGHAMSGDVPPGAVAAAMCVLTAACLRSIFPDHGAGLLADIGLEAAREAGTS